MSKKIGIIGSTGRMGQLLQQKIGHHPSFTNGPGFSRSQSSLEFVFNENDYVVDFSSPELIQEILNTAIKFPKPLVICTTGWLEESFNVFFKELSKKVPIVTASNTSIGAFLQRYLVCEIARILNSDYDVDIFEKHHRNKKDIPSGTAKSLIHDLIDVKQRNYGITYQASIPHEGPRVDHSIGLSIQRSGDIPGEHEVTFTNEDEMISIKHVAFNRSLFAQGALKIIEWLEKTHPQPGLYTMEDVLNINISK